MKIAITGAGGFIGSRLQKHFLSIGHEVHAIARQTIQDSKLHYHKINLPSSEVYSLLENIKPDVMIHAAGQSSVPNSVIDPAADFAAGPPVVFELLDALRIHSPETIFIFLSSAAVYGNPSSMPIKESSSAQPISPYGHHKLLSEMIVSEFASIYGIRCTSARIFSAYGNGLRRQLLWDICRKAHHGDKVELMGSGMETRDYIHVNDVASAIATLVETSPLTGSAVNICSGISTNIAEIAAMIASRFPHKPQIQFTGIQQAGAPKNWQGDNAWLKSRGFECSISLSQGVDDYVRWYETLQRAGS
jgi:UDP-glucose 4-epimerase